MKVAFAFFINTLFNFGIGLLVARFLGPDQFGRFALAIAVGVVLQTIFFDWLRLSAVRFYSERVRDLKPELRATLDVAFAGLAIVVTFFAVLLLLSGVNLPLSNELVGLGIAASVTNGLFDYSTALVRARFQDSLYSRLILLKNGLSLVFTAGGALLFGSATAALAGVCVSMAGSVLIAREALHDRAAQPRLAQSRLAREYLTYAAPIVIANALYLAIPLANRGLLAQWHGFTDTGQFSLAYDIGIRIVAAIGSVLDVLLFQMAVRADELHGAEHGRAQVARNVALLFAILLPTCCGVWLTLPSLEQLIIPESYRGPFADYFTTLLPGFFAFGMINFAINPVFQIAKRTLPMIVGACVACAVDAALIAILPSEANSLAIAQAGSMLAGMLVLGALAVASGAQRPPLRDLCGALVATGAMIAITLPLRQWRPGVLTLGAEVIAGLMIFAIGALLFNIAGVRTHLWQHRRLTLAR